MSKLRKLACVFVAAQFVLAASGADASSNEREPDPRDLLQRVARARNQIISGEMEFEVAAYVSSVPLDGTNHIRLKILFDGEKRRCEWTDRAYSCVIVGPEAAKLTDAKRQELGLDVDAGVRAGLLTQSEFRHVAAYDGAVCIHYYQADDQPPQTTIEDPRNSGVTYLFDPRILGLTPYPSVTDTIDSCLVQNHADSTLLLGNELLEGVAVWHVRVVYSKSRSIKCDFWIDANHPSHVCKQERNGDTVVSIFDSANPDDPIPKEVRIVNFYEADHVFTEKRYLRRSAQFNIPVDPASWTLAGLGMPVGTDVVDYRISKSIGWWNGSRLSEDTPPRTKQIRPVNPPNLSNLLELAKKDPDSPFAANACFSVATLLKRSASEGSDERATKEAERLFERVIADYGQVQSGGTKLSDLAKRELSELRRQGVGNVAQEIEGENLEGKKMKLSDYRGKVVVLTFWATWCPPCMVMVPDERRLVERMTGKAFAMIGVNADSERSKEMAVVANERITWPSFQDGGRNGPIATAWCVHGWPTIYVLDPKGVIRYRNVQGPALAAAVDSLIHEGK